MIRFATEAEPFATDLLPADEAVTKVSWSTDKDVLKIVFLAGDATLTRKGRRRP